MTWAGIGTESLILLWDEFWVVPSDSSKDKCFIIYIYIFTFKLNYPYISIRLRLEIICSVMSPTQELNFCVVANIVDDG